MMQKLNILLMFNPTELIIRMLNHIGPCVIILIWKFDANRFRSLGWGGAGSSYIRRFTSSRKHIGNNKILQKKIQCYYFSICN